ncbi:MAG: peptidoglycan-binding domain-containing protein, partial [Thermoanaerobaculia bacterium]
MKMKTTLAAALILVAACSRQEVRERTDDAKQKVAEVTGFAVPLGQRDDPKQREQQRFDERWRNLRSFRQQQAQRAARQAGQAQQQAAVNLKFVTGAKETFKDLNVPAINAAPISVPITGDVTGPSVVKTQVYLDRLHFSVGVLDGRWGRNSAIATWWFQRSRDLEPTGAVDEPTFRRLAAEAGAGETIVAHPL